MDSGPVTDEQIAELRAAMEEQREEIRQALVDDGVVDSVDAFDATGR